MRNQWRTIGDGYGRRTYFSEQLYDALSSLRASLEEKQAGFLGVRLSLFRRHRSRDLRLNNTSLTGSGGSIVRLIFSIRCGPGRS